ncbi:AraC family transcriptional regulator [Paenibacillus periandrae]|uniref:AraC family transcriptional regulator n=1 Tax=Paenibacillus periandrae TaxID=1761741 RepID=UPI001F0991B2|nr:AraC family transcriptional regulator [Paenibacillus periandrae]
MGLTSIFRSRTYFIRILFTVTLLLALFLLIFSSVLYTYSKNMALELQQEANRKVLNQINYNIDNLNETLRSLATTAFNDRDVTALMNTREIEVFELYNKLYKLDIFVSSNPFIHSIWIYNAFNGCYYTTGLASMVSCLEPDNRSTGNLLKPYIVRSSQLPKFTLLPIMNGNAEDKQKLFAYMTYNKLGDYTPQESVLMLAIKGDWFYDNIRRLNELGENSLGDLFILDANGNYFSPANEAPLTDEIRKEMTESIQSATDSTGYFMLGEGESKKIVTYLKSKANGWNIVSVQPYDHIFSKINSLYTFIVVILGVFLLLAFAASALATVRLYRPLGRLMKQIRTNPASQLDAQLDDKDELSLMSSVYENIATNIQKLQTEQSSNHSILHNYRWRRLITDSAAITAKEAEEYLPLPGIQEADSVHYLVVVLKIDDFIHFKEERSESEQRLCRFAVTNITSEVLREHFPNQPIDMKQDHTAVMVAITKNQRAALYGELTRLIAFAQKTLDSYYSLSLTASISRPFDDYRETSTHYEQALAQTLYRTIYGKMSVITPELARNHINGKDYEIPYELEKRLAGAIRSNDPVDRKVQLDTVFSYVSGLDPEIIDFAILQLLMIIHRTVREISANILSTMVIEVKAFNQKVLEQETLNEVRQLVFDLLEEVDKQLHTAKESKNEYLIEAVKEIIETNYADENLSLQFVASALRMSPSYLGRFFRSSEGISIADTIIEVRLSRALEQLEQEGEQSIAAVMKQVGFSNESHFFKHFKKKTGSTPREYRLKKANEK